MKTISILKNALFEMERGQQEEEDEEEGNDEDQGKDGREKGDALTT